MHVDLLFTGGVVGRKQTVTAHAVVIPALLGNVRGRSALARHVQ